MSLLGDPSRSDFSSSNDTSSRSENPLSVTRLVRKMKHVLEIEVGELWVKGEVSGLRRQLSGHCYFTIKDQKAALSCVLFARQAKQYMSLLEEGRSLILFGEVSLYEARGQAQFIVQKIKEAGKGTLQEQFEALKKKLHKEGLFDAERKQALPPFPRVIGLITSPTGAALQDMLTILNRRAPWIQVQLLGVRVQGAGAEQDLIRAIQSLSRPVQNEERPPCDLIIAGRGGGSIEDLWCFNDEALARAIANCPIPFISAVGHEIDFTIADFVADYRAPTPSAAAEIAVPDREALRQQLHQNQRSLTQVMQYRITRLTERSSFLKRYWMNRSPDTLLRQYLLRYDDLREDYHQAGEALLRRYEERLSHLKNQLTHLHPEHILSTQLERTYQLAARLKEVVQHQLMLRTQRLSNAQDLLKAYGPQSAFERGWSMTLSETGKLIRDPKELQSGERLITHVAQGTIQSRVE